jgi:hypothetical protein
MVDPVDTRFEPRLQLDLKSDENSTGVKKTGCRCSELWKRTTSGI